MTEETPPAKKKTARKVRAATSPNAATPDDGLLTPRNLALLGVVLVGGVIAWKLLGTSYTHDVETICNAEKGSGQSAEHDASKLTQWIRDHLGTPEGNELYSTLGDTHVAERAKKLQEAADAQHVSPCPLVATYQVMSAHGDARSDVQHLCSDLTFPKLATSDDDARMAMLHKWIDTSAKSPDTKALGAAMQQAAAGPDRAKVLSDAANKMDIFTCNNARALSTPPASVPNGAPLVRLYSELQIIGGAKDEDVKKALADMTPDLVACYQDGLGRKPDLVGKLVVKAEFDSTGKIRRADPAEGAQVADAQTGTCILTKLRTMKIPVSGPLVSVLFPIELTHDSK
jgi:hypothetical protein